MVIESETVQKDLIRFRERSEQELSVGLQPFCKRAFRARCTFEGTDLASLHLLAHLESTVALCGTYASPFVNL